MYSQLLILLMLVIQDIYELILKYVDLQDFISLSTINKNNNDYITKHKHYLKFKTFFGTYNDYIFNLKKNKHIYDKTIDFHKKCLAIGSKCNKIINYFYVTPKMEIIDNRVLLQFIMKNDSVETFKLFHGNSSNSIKYICLLFALRYQSHSILSTYFTDNIIQVDLSGGKSYIYYFDYIYKYNMYYKCDKEKLKNLVLSNQRLTIIMMSKNVRTLDIVIKIFLKLNIDVDFVGYFNNLSNMLSDGIFFIPNYVRPYHNLNKLYKYLSIHSPSKNYI